MVLQSSLLSRSIKVDHRRPNMYALLSGPPSKGKGHSMDQVENAMWHMDLKTINVSSNKTFLRMLGSNPWGVLRISEFRCYMTKGHFLHDTLSTLCDAFDAPSVSQSSERTGICWVRGAAPSLIGGIQTNAFTKTGAMVLDEIGMLARTLIGLDDSVTPEMAVLTRIKRQAIDHARIANAFKDAYAWLPQPMTPGAEQTDAKPKGKQIEHVKMGRWVHPQSEWNLSSEPYDHIWLTHKFPGHLAPNMQRLCDNYLSLLSIPFAPVDALLSHVIPVDAMMKGERAMLACYWNLLSVVRMMPGQEGEELVKSLESKIRAAGTDGITRKMLQRSVRHCRGQDFKSAIETIENRGLAVFQDAEAKNKAVSRRFWAPELQPKPGTRPKEL